MQGASQLGDEGAREASRHTETLRELLSEAIMLLSSRATPSGSTSITATYHKKGQEQGAGAGAAAGVRTTARQPGRGCGQQQVVQR
jgi:hypothetical protein